MVPASVVNGKSTHCKCCLPVGYTAPRMHSRKILFPRSFRQSWLKVAAAAMQLSSSPQSPGDLAEQAAGYTPEKQRFLKSAEIRSREGSVVLCLSFYHKVPPECYCFPINLFFFFQKLMCVSSSCGLYRPFPFVPRLQSPFRCAMFAHKPLLRRRLPSYKFHNLPHQKPAPALSVPPVRDRTAAFLPEHYIP